MVAVPEVRSTTSLPESSRQFWDVLIIGAGPSGALAARQLAIEGARVLLVDRANFPRRKVCGCCLNGAALRILHEVGLGHIERAAGSAVVNHFRMGSRGRQVTLPIHTGIAVSREFLDSMLVQAAVDSGADFLDGVLATIESTEAASISVRLKSSSPVGIPQELSAHARWVLIAGGLGCRAFADPARDERAAAKGSRIGAGTILSESASDYPPGTIHMACHRSGYVGLVRLHDQRLDIAAALDAADVRDAGGIGPLVERIIQSAGFTQPAALNGAHWTGTARLTQSRSSVYGDRYFVIGDAAGYVEPFTGEGMAWALASGRAVAPIVASALRSEADDSDGFLSHPGQDWNQVRNRLLNKRARACRRLSRLLRYPALVNLGVRALAWNPALSKPFVGSLNLPYNTSEGSGGRR